MKWRVSEKHHTKKRARELFNSTRMAGCKLSAFEIVSYDVQICGFIARYLVSDLNASKLSHFRHDQHLFCVFVHLHEVKFLQKDASVMTADGNADFKRNKFLNFFVLYISVSLPACLSVCLLTHT